jgi:hypothetical protein
VKSSRSNIDALFASRIARLHVCYAVLISMDSEWVCMLFTAIMLILPDFILPFFKTASTVNTVVELQMAKICSLSYAV